VVRYRWIDIRSFHQPRLSRWSTVWDTYPSTTNMIRIVRPSLLCRILWLRRTRAPPNCSAVVCGTPESESFTQGRLDIQGTQPELLPPGHVTSNLRGSAKYPQNCCITDPACKLQSLSSLAGWYKTKTLKYKPAALNRCSTSSEPYTRYRPRL
jgi:hypothetical protein